VAQAEVDFSPSPTPVAAFEHTFGDAIVVVRVVVGGSVKDLRVLRVGDDFADEMVVKDALPSSTAVGAFENPAEVEALG